MAVTKQQGRVHETFQPTTKRMSGLRVSRIPMKESVPCERCRGLLVPDSCMDLLDDQGLQSVWTFRCVQCGNLIDPVIDRNRQTLCESLGRRKPTRRFRGLHNLSVDVAVREGSP